MRGAQNFCNEDNSNRKHGRLTVRTHADHPSKYQITFKDMEFMEPTKFHKSKFNQGRSLQKEVREIHTFLHATSCSDNYAHLMLSKYLKGCIT